MNFLYRIKQFMQGRYGLDQLTVALIVLGVALTSVFSILHLIYLRPVGWIPYFIALWRVLSKNIERRQRENERFVRLSQPWKDFIKRKQSQAQDYDHKYYNCPKCGHTLRVPKGRGKIEITCPYCKKKFKKNTGKSS